MFMLDLISRPKGNALYTVFRTRELLSHGKERNLEFANVCKCLQTYSFDLKFGRGPIDIHLLPGNDHFLHPRFPFGTLKDQKTNQRLGQYSNISISGCTRMCVADCEARNVKQLLNCTYLSLQAYNRTEKLALNYGGVACYPILHTVSPFFSCMLTVLQYFDLVKTLLSN